MKQPTDVYLHYDTLSLKSSAAIIGLGAGFFSLGDGDTLRLSPRYWSVTLAEQEPMGRTIDAASLDWWRTDGEYSDPMNEAKFTLAEAFSRMLSEIEETADIEAVRVWVWNSMLEGAITQSLIETFDVVAPWRYWNVFEARTFTNVPLLYAGEDEQPAPHGVSPRSHIDRRIEAIQTAHFALAARFDNAPQLEVIAR